MPTFRLFRDGGTEIVDTVDAGLATARARGGFIWVELDHPVVGDFVDIAATLGLHELAVADAVNARDRPKLDIYEEQQFFGLLTLRYSGATVPLGVGRVMAFIGDAFVVTVRQEEDDTLERARRRLERAHHEGATPFDVLHAVVDTVVEDLAVVSRRVESSIVDAADRLFARQRSDEAHSLYQITRQLLAMAHAVQPLIEPLRHLSSGSLGRMSSEEARRFQDVLDHALVLDREVGDYSELVEHLRGSNDSRIGLQQNTDMRKIASWAAIIAVPTAVSGFYGMNVPYPGSAEAAGVLTAVTLQVVLAVSLFLVFRRRGWL